MSTIRQLYYVGKLIVMLYSKIYYYASLLKEAKQLSNKECFDYMVHRIISGRK